MEGIESSYYRSSFAKQNRTERNLGVLAGAVLVSPFNTFYNSNQKNKFHLQLIGD
jgi:hypothetical protein